ncbi:MAG: TerC family protein [Planctomyces sp.]|nr:TerC family protein [Planctomyces sp.]
MDWVLPLITLTAMEVVLGIDNIVFIAILAARLPVEQQAKARSIGLMAALGTRLLLLFSITWVLKMDQPSFYLTDLGVPAGWLGVDPDNPKGLPIETAEPPANPRSHAAGPHSRGLGINGISVKDMILFFGGLFLVWKSVREIHHKIEGPGEERQVQASSFAGVVGQIAFMDIIFSLDSVITAVGMVNQVWVMVVAIIIAIGVMLRYAGAVSRFVDRHPTLKMLALSFLILIGVMLIAEGIGTHFPKGYIYFAMAFSLLVEMLNMRVRPAAAVAARAAE